MIFTRASVSLALKWGLIALKWGLIVVYVNPALRTLFICALAMTEYLNSENLQNRNVECPFKGSV